MAITTASQNLAQVDKKVKIAFNTGARGYISQYEKVFIMETPERRNEKFTIVKTNSGVQEVTDGAPYPVQDVSELGENTISVRVYKSAIVISDLADLFDNYGAIMRTAQTRGYHFKAKMDALAADFLNNATATNSPYGINIAGATYPLVGTAQAIGDTGATQSNRVSGALDKTTLNQARVQMRKMKDHDGMIAAYQARRLVVPSEEIMNAWQITYSPGEPESANRNDNYLKTLGIECIEWPLLTSTTASFLLADKSDLGAKGLRFEVKELPSARRILDQNTGNPMYQMRMVVFPGVIDYMGVQGIL